MFKWFFFEIHILFSNLKSVFLIIRLTKGPGRCNLIVIVLYLSRKQVKNNFLNQENDLNSLNIHYCISFTWKFQMLYYYNCFERNVLWLAFWLLDSRCLWKLKLTQKITSWINWGKHSKFTDFVSKMKKRIFTYSLFAMWSGWTSHWLKDASKTKLDFW